MNASRKTTTRHRTRRLLAVIALGIGVILTANPSASAATTATFSNGVLMVTGDAASNSIVISRDAAGQILVNGGAVPISGGTPTVANTSLIRVLGLAGNDGIALDQSSGALPAAQLFGGANNDALTGGSGADQLFGQGGADTLQAKGGNDQLLGGTESDTLTGGDADDQVFGDEGDDRMIWNPGDDTDLNEGDDGVDTVEVIGSSGAEQFSTTANGARVRFDRVAPAAFSIDIGTSENLVLKANGGDDSFFATGNLAALIALTVDGGAGLDSLFGGNGPDLLLGGDAPDFVDGNQGNDSVKLGAGGDGVTDRVTVNGTAGNDHIAITGGIGAVAVTGLVPAVSISSPEAAKDRLDVNTLAGTDTVSFNGAPQNQIQLFVDGVKVT